MKDFWRALVIPIELLTIWLFCFVHLVVFSLFKGNYFGSALLYSSLATLFGWYFFVAFVLLKSVLLAFMKLFNVEASRKYFIETIFVSCVFVMIGLSFKQYSVISGMVGYVLIQYMFYLR